MKKVKTYVLTVSRTFPNYHPQKGKHTFFEVLISNAIREFNNQIASDPIPPQKIHTIRGNYELWKKRIDNINKGKAILSIRYWSGKPYNSPQVEFQQLTKVGIQRISIDFQGYDSCLMDMEETEFKHKENYVIAMNDGLTEEDFKSWFKAKNFSGCIIHFTNFRY